MASRFIPAAPSDVTPDEQSFLQVLKTIQTLGRIASRDADEVRENILREHRRECVEVLRRAGFPCPNIVDGI